MVVPPTTMPMSSPSLIFWSNISILYVNGKDVITVADMEGWSYKNFHKNVVKRLKTGLWSNERVNHYLYANPVFALNNVMCVKGVFLPYFEQLIRFFPEFYTKFVDNGADAHISDVEYNLAAWERMSTTGCPVMNGRRRLPAPAAPPVPPAVAGGGGGAPGAPGGGGGAADRGSRAAARAAARGD